MKLENTSYFSIFLTIFFKLGFSTMLLRFGFYKTKGVTSVHLILAMCLAVMLQKTKLDYVLSNNLDVSDKKIALYRYVARTIWLRNLQLQLA